MLVSLSTLSRERQTKIVLRKVTLIYMYCTCEFAFGLFAFHGNETNDRRSNRRVSFPDHPLRVGYLCTFGIRRLYYLHFCATQFWNAWLVQKWTNFSGSAILGILTSCCAKMANTQNLTHALLERWNWCKVPSSAIVQYRKLQMHNW